MRNRVLIISAECNRGYGFAELVENLQNRIGLVKISGVCGDKKEILKELNSYSVEKVSDILIIPVGIPCRDEFMTDLNDAIAEFIENEPEVNLKVISKYLSESSLEDQIWESINAEYTDSSLLPDIGKNIETLSHMIIDKKLHTVRKLSLKEKIITRRVIHATADYSFAHTMKFSYKAVDAGVAALREKKPIICDVNMLKTAMTHVDSEVICLISDAEIIELAKKNKCTRAAAAILSLKDRLDGAIVVIGNAPTAIWQLLKLKVEPALVVGLPVGFVGAREAKMALIDSGLTFIANTSPRGGSPAAAAALNALALMAKKSLS